MDKEKEIEEMTTIIGKNTFAPAPSFLPVFVCGQNDAAIAISNAGYRKADEVRKETAKEILQELVGIMNAKCDDINADELNIIAKKYGVEVDE